MGVQIANHCTANDYIFRGCVFSVNKRYFQKNFFWLFTAFSAAALDSSFGTLNGSLNNCLWMNPDQIASLPSSSAAGSSAPILVGFRAWFKRRGFEVTVRTLSGLDQVTLSSRKTT